jgi:hypothetical protein
MAKMTRHEELSAAMVRERLRRTGVSLEPRPNDPDFNELARRVSLAIRPRTRLPRAVISALCGPEE